MNCEEFTLRDRFALTAIDRLRADGFSDESVAKQAYRFADAMISAREEEVAPTDTVKQDSKKKARRA